MEQGADRLADECLDRAVAVDLGSWAHLGNAVGLEGRLGNEPPADLKTLAQRIHCPLPAEEVEEDRWLLPGVGALELDPADAPGPQIGDVQQEAMAGEA